MLIPFFADRKLYWADINTDISLEEWLEKANKQLTKAISNRDKSYGKLMNDGFIGGLSDKGKWEELFLEEKKWSDSYWEVVDLENTISLMTSIHGMTGISPKKEEKWVISRKNELYLNHFWFLGFLDPNAGFVL